MKCLVTQIQDKASTFLRLPKMTCRMALLAVLCFCFPAITLNAQDNVLVKGRITDERGQPVVNASIIVKGTTTGANSNESGNFEISAPRNATLVISYVGYAPREIRVSDQPLNISLTPAGNDMEQVVVVGYGTQKKKDVTGAVVSVNEKALKEVPGANIQQLLQGRAAGLEIQRIGTMPGSGAQIRIRGERTINGSNDPLIVLDGIPFEGGSLNDINPDEIASIDILKDASATAIYGSRGANGIILITTKRGRVGEPRISYNGYHGISSVARKYEVFSAEEYRAMRDLSPWNGGYMPEEVKGISLGRNTDWQDIMYKNGFITDHNLNVSGGTATSQFSLGGGYFKETTVLPGQDFTRYALRATIDSRIGKRLKIGLNTLNNLNITHGSQFPINMFPLLTLSPLMPPYDSAGNIVKSPAGNVDDKNTYNPLMVKNNYSGSIDRVRRIRTFNSLYAEYQIIEGLKYRLNVGLDFRQQEGGQFRGADSYFRPAQGNTATVNNAEGWGYTVENLLTYDRTFKDVHRLNVVALYSIQEDRSHTSSISKDSIDEEFIQFYNLGQASSSATLPPVVSGTESSWALISYMARINYAFDDRFLLTLTGRIDGSSRLAPGNKWHKYPAVSAGWNISREKFMDNITFINNLKLRVGFGQTSNQSINPYASLGSVSPINGINTTASGAPGPGGSIRYNYGPTVVTGYAVTSLPNPDLDWEYTKTVNVGLDFSVLDNRISGTIEWYRQHTFNILYGIQLPSTSGITGQFITNIGEMENKGLEVSISTMNVRARTPGGFTWSTDLNVFFNRNKLLKLNDGFQRNIGNGLHIGHPLTAIYDYTKLGIWQLDEAAAAATYGYVPGQIKLADLNGPNGKPDGRIDPDYDRSIIGSSEADWQGGMTNRFAYKGFDLSIVAYARMGGLLISQIHQPLTSYLTILDGKRNGIKVDYWTPTNPTNSFPKPQAQFVNSLAANAWSTLGYYDASFVKIRSINLGYTFSRGILNRIKAQSVRVHFTAQNPFVLFSPYIDAGGVDPEATGQGNRGPNGNGDDNTGVTPRRALVITAATPPTRSFILGVNLSF